MYEAVTSMQPGDAIIAVCQDNYKKIIFIEGFDENIERLLHYNEDDMIGRNVNIIFGSKVTEAIESYLEYNDSTHSLDVVLNKIRDFSLINLDGEHVDVHAKTHNVATSDRGLHFEIVIRPITIEERLDDFKEHVPVAKSNQVHEDLGILNEEAVRKELKVMIDFSDHNMADMVIGLISIEHVKIFSNVKKLLIPIIEVLEKKLEKRDIIGYYGHGEILFAIIDCNANKAINVIDLLHRSINNRLANFSSSLGERVSSSISYMNFSGLSLEETFAKLENGTSEAKSLGGNQICNRS